MQALNQITNAMDDIDTIIQRHLKDYVQVPRRYKWRGIAVNEWHVIFYFKEESDAVMFGLKY
jgi:hypothetical protein